MTTMIAKKPTPPANGTPAVADRAALVAELTSLDGDPTLAALRQQRDLAHSARLAAQRAEAEACAALAKAEQIQQSRRHRLRKALYMAAPLDAIQKLMTRLIREDQQVRNAERPESAQRSQKLLSAARYCQDSLPFDADPAARMTQLEKLLQEK